MSEQTPRMPLAGSPPISLAAKQTGTEAALAAFTPALLARAFKGEP